MTHTVAHLGVGAAVIRLTTAVGERVLEARAASGLSTRQLQVLRLAADGVRMGALVRGLGTPKSTLTSVVDQLEAQGLATRTGDDDDRRGHVVRSSDAGAAALRDFDRDLAHRVDGLLAGLSAARASRLRQLLSSLPDASVPIPLSGSR